MEINEIDSRSTEFISELIEVWEKSVTATHDFLTPEAIAEIRAYLPAALAGIPKLVTAREDTKLIGFAGVDKNKLEMLFIDPSSRGRGIGRRLIQYLFDYYEITEVCVNEQNPQARGFYEHVGFEVHHREPLDEQGQPYPLLYMRRFVG